MTSERPLLTYSTQELGPEQHWVSETIFGIAFATFVLWTFTPFVTQRKRFYTAVMWSRLLMVLVGEFSGLCAVLLFSGKTQVREGQAQGRGCRVP